MLLGKDEVNKRPHKKRFGGSKYIHIPNVYVYIYIYIYIYIDIHVQYPEVGFPFLSAPSSHHIETSCLVIYGQSGSLQEQ